MRSSLVLGYSLWDNRKKKSHKHCKCSFRWDVFIVFAVEVIAKALYCQAMRVHVNGSELLVNPDGFSLVTCHCTLRYKQKTEIKPKLLTVLKIKASKKALPRSCLVFKHTANV